MVRSPPRRESEMSSVEAARHGEAALRAVGESAPSSSHLSRSAGVHQNNASDAFASLFEAARANYGTRPEPSDSRQSFRSDAEGSNPSSSAGKEDADAQ